MKSLREQLVQSGIASFDKVKEIEKQKKEQQTKELEQKRKEWEQKDSLND